jgi:hypothetical protein
MNRQRKKEKNRKKNTYLGQAVSDVERMRKDPFHE